MTGKLTGMKQAQGPRSPIASTGIHTFDQQGRQAWQLEAKAELFTLAATNMVGEDTFYEDADTRDERFAHLVAAVAIEDPAWVFRFGPYLRGTLNMRTASLVLAVEAVLAWRDPDNKVTLPEGVTVRGLIDSVCQRADEPGELISYWQMRAGQRSLPGGVQRGLSDACGRLFGERTAIKWDGQGKAWRLGDVVEVVHPTPTADWQNDVYEWLLDRRRHGQDPLHDEQSDVMWDRVSTLHAYEQLRTKTTAEQRRWLLEDPDRIRACGLSWEYVAGLGPMTDLAWAAVAPHMGYMALLRNLRNFDQAGMTDTAAEAVLARLSDPEQVAGSRQLPFRFLTAYREAPSLRWGYALSKALDASLVNVPVLTGKSLVLVDTSQSMTNRLSAKSSVSRLEAGSVLALGLAGSAVNVDVAGFAAGVFVYAHQREKGVLRQAAEIASLMGQVGHNTYTANAVRTMWREHGPYDRVLIVTDDRPQDGDPGQEMPANVPLYVINVGGYGASAIRPGVKHRHMLGGLSDATFRLIPVLEAGRDAVWPF